MSGSGKVTPAETSPPGSTSGWRCRQGIEGASRVFETTVETQKMKHVPLEPWVTLTYWDEDDRLVILTSTQVPFHVRRILAPVLGLPESRIRVIKPRIGAAFGNKQEIYEDIPAHLTLATGRPVLLSSHARRAVHLYHDPASHAGIVQDRCRRGWYDNRPGYARHQ